MKKRLVYLLLFFVAVLLAFVLQKPCFMLYNDAISRGVSFNDYIQVMWHGVSLDTTTAGYLTAIPWLTVLVSVWFKRFPLRKLLVAYYAIIALVVSIVFIVDMGLYPFWKFKLDASVAFCCQCVGTLSYHSVGIAGGKEEDSRNRSDDTHRRSVVCSYQRRRYGVDCQHRAGILL